MGWHDGLAERRPVPQVRVGACPGPAEGNMAGRKRREDVRLVEPVSLLGLSLGDVLLGLMETGEGRPDPAPGDAASTAVENEPALRLRMPDGRVEREPLLGGFWRLDRTGGLTVPRVVTRREGKALACKLYRVGEGRALYAGVLKAAGARAFVEAKPGAAFRYRNASLRRMTAGEVAAAVDPDRAYDYDLLGAGGGAGGAGGGGPAAPPSCRWRTVRGLDRRDRRPRPGGTRGGTRGRGSGPIGSAPASVTSGPS